MIRKSLLTISLLLPLMAMAGIANAGIVNSDKRYWPNEVGPLSYAVVVTDSGTVERKRSSRRAAPSHDAGRRRHNVAKSCTYQGGPKSGLWACR